METNKVMNAGSRIPEEYKEYDEAVMSNLDHDIRNEVAEHIKGKPLYSQYSGWNFCGQVWWECDMWNCEVWVYGSWQRTFNSDSLEEIMDDVSSEYGAD